MKTVFVTGGTGYIGRVLISKLLNQGYSVKSLVRDTKRLSALPLKHPHLQIIPGDLDTIAALKQGVATADIIFHLAASLRMFEKKSEPYHTNIRGTENLLRACMELKQKVKFIFASSLEAVGPNREKLTEPGTAPQPVTDYGKSKLKGERIIKRFCQEHQNITYTIVRIGNTYDQNGGIVQALKEMCRQRTWQASLLRYELKDCSLALIHLKDLVNMLLLLVDNEKTDNKTYFAVTECLSIEEIVAMIERKKDLNNNLRRVPFGETVLSLWNLTNKSLKRSDLLTYLSIGGKRKFRSYRDGNVLTDLKFISEITLEIIMNKVNNESLYNHSYL